MIAFPERLLLHDVCIGSGYSAYATIEESSRQPPAARGPDYRVMRAGSVISLVVNLLVITDKIQITILPLIDHNPCNKPVII